MEVQAGRRKKKRTSPWNSVPFRCGLRWRTHGAPHTGGVLSTYGRETRRSGGAVSNGDEGEMLRFSCWAARRPLCCGACGFFFWYPSANPTAREVAVTYQPSMSCQRDSPALGKAQPGMACQRVGGQTGLTRSAHELQASPVATFSFLPLTFLFLKEKQNWIPVSPFAAGLWPLSQR